MNPNSTADSMPNGIRDGHVRIETSRNLAGKKAHQQVACGWGEKEDVKSWDVKTSKNKAKRGAQQFVANAKNMSMPSSKSSNAKDEKH